MWYKNIKNQLNHLPGEQVHLEMIPYRKLKGAYNLDQKNARASAVLCLLQKTNKSLSCLLIERQDDGGKHSGQIAFPGGKKDKTDSNLQYTALRETHEEVGIPSREIEVLGELTSVYIPVSNFLVQPFLGILNQPQELILSPNEVKSAFWIDLDELIHPNSKQCKSIKNHNGMILKDIPCFELNNKIVWGATSLILNELKAIIKSSNLLKV